jgi:PAS domain S-box-containing protein
MSVSIFIVEDERIVAEDIRVTLESHGYAVAGIAASRDQAIDEIRRTTPNLVLMDIMLKGPGDGVEAARLVRDLFDLPVVYLTAHADQATLRRARTAGPFGYVVKPFVERELCSAIEMALYRYRVEKRIENQERWLAAILRSLGHAVIAADAMGVVRFANAAAESLLGCSHAELMGADLVQVYRLREISSGLPLELPSLPVLMEEWSADGAGQVHWLTRLDGGRIPVQQNIRAISDATGIVLGSLWELREAPGPQDEGRAFPEEAL